MNNKKKEDFLSFELKIKEEEEKKLKTENVEI